MTTATNVATVHQLKPQEATVNYDDQPPLIPEGEYLAKFIHYETAWVFKAPRVFLWFELIDGEYSGKRLYRAYRVKSIQESKAQSDKPRRNGRFTLARGHHLFKMLCRVLEIKARPDRISLLGLRHCVLRVKVETVKQDYDQDRLQEWLWYSKISDVLLKETG